MKKTLGKTMALAFLSLILIVVSLNSLSRWMFKGIEEASTEIEKNWLPSIVALDTLSGDVVDFQILQLHHILSSDPEQMRRYEKQMQSLLQKIRRDQERYRPLISSAQERAVYEPFEEKWAEYLKIHEDQFLPLSRVHKEKEAHQVLVDNGPLFSDLSGDLDRTIEFNWSGGVSATHAGNKIYAKMLVFTQALFVVSVLLAVGISVLLTRLR